MSILLWPFSPSVVIGGTYSGQIVLWDMRSRHNQPVLRSPLSSIGTVSISYRK
jgi:dynein intermediate chain